MHPKFAILSLALVACSSRHHVEPGLASWYGPGFKGNPTASGETFRPYKLTAAHKTLPMGTVVHVSRTDNGKTVRVTINDRGPYVEGRIIDLSKKAARRLDMIDDGVAPVEIRVVGCKRSYGGC